MSKESIELRLHGQGGIGIAVRPGGTVYFNTPQAHTIQFIGESPVATGSLSQEAGAKVPFKINANAAPGVYPFVLSALEGLPGAKPHKLYLIVVDPKSPPEQDEDPSEGPKNVRACRYPPECPP